MPGRNNRICESSTWQCIDQSAGCEIGGARSDLDRVRGEAEDIVRREPELASFIYFHRAASERLEDSVVHRIAERLDHSGACRAT